MLQNIPFPVLPVPPSWYPGHMTQFTRLLPTQLRRTDVVLELRDSRLPLTSINPNFEGALRTWRSERGGGFTGLSKYSPSSQSPAIPSASASAGLYKPVCERIVVFNKRDLVPEWGLQPFRKAMSAKYPDQTVFFASWNRSRDVKALSDLLIDIAKRNVHAPELNVLVVGMPNVGKSTLLNALRSTGISGPTAKALRTSAQPGLTRALSTRLKLSVDPLVYAYDTPGVMLPFLGQGDKGAERGVKLALIAGIKEGLYDAESLAAYLLYRLNVLDPIAPAYLQLLPPSTPPMVDVEPFLDALARRLGMLKKGGITDPTRAAVWFIKWWREQGGIEAAKTPILPAAAASSSSHTALPAAHRRGWGFDLEWTVGEVDLERYDESVIQRKMEECIDRFEEGIVEEAKEGGGVSLTQQKKRLREQELVKRAARTKARLARKSGR